MSDLQTVPLLPYSHFFNTKEGSNTQDRARCEKLISVLSALGSIKIGFSLPLAREMFKRKHAVFTLRPADEVALVEYEILCDTKKDEFFLRRYSSADHDEEHGPFSKEIALVFLRTVLSFLFYERQELDIIEDLKKTAEQDFAFRKTLQEEFALFADILKLEDIFQDIFQEKEPVSEEQNLKDEVSRLCLDKLATLQEIILSRYEMKEWRKVEFKGLVLFLIYEMAKTDFFAEEDMEE